MSSTRRKGKQNKHKGKKKKKRKERTGQTFERGGPGDHDRSGAVNYVVVIDAIGMLLKTTTLSTAGDPSLSSARSFPSIVNSFFFLSPLS